MVMTGCSSYHGNEDSHISRHFHNALKVLLMFIASDAASHVGQGMRGALLVDEWLWASQENTPPEVFRLPCNL